MNGHLHCEDYKCGWEQLEKDDTLSYWLYHTLLLSKTHMVDVRCENKSLHSLVIYKTMIHILTYILYDVSMQTEMIVIQTIWILK